MVLERPGELIDCAGDRQVEEQLEPARATLVSVVSVSRAQ
jgi:hypothetical protein